MDTQSQADINNLEQLLLKTKNNPLIQSFFVAIDKDPYEGIEWKTFHAAITDEKGNKVFEQNNVEAPSIWSETAVNIVSSKYFNGSDNFKESSVRQLINRVVKTISNWGLVQNYFSSASQALIFENELTYLLVHQMAAFNSPVWFNCGIETKPQCSACFINSIDDHMESILDLAKIEGMLFKWGSGTGTNLSPIRSSKEKMSNGGKPSGPVSFMKGFDSFAGAIKSGGKTRRAAKMVILNIDHPDIKEFIDCKANEEKKAWALIDEGYDGSFNGEAYNSIFFQNSNNSVRVTDEFMRAVIEDKEWHTKAVTTGAITDTYKARDLMRSMADSAHICGDPGIQYDTTINSWHTCPNSGRIQASNPCSEYMFLNDSACNLASLNLMKFRMPNGDCDVSSFTQAIHILITAMDIIVSNASYPTPAIAANSEKYRPLGLGYANLGALLMSQGLAYDSEEGRNYASAITALLCGQAYKTSALLSRRIGPHDGYRDNQEPTLKVIKRHAHCMEKIHVSQNIKNIVDEATKCWNDAYRIATQYGIRNAQTTVLAPTGTIGFMMDCDTTGIEPDIALVKYKKLVDGGFIKIVNKTVLLALKNLDYTPIQSEAIIQYINQNDTIEGAPELKSEHLPIFDCAFKSAKGNRFIHYMGHIRMMSAVQPFISGAISKTVNLPHEATVEDIENVYIEAWKMGIKSIAIYRDGSKRTQPLTTNTDTGQKSTQKLSETEWNKRRRRRLSDERHSITHKFSVAGHEGYIHVGLYDDGTPGEIFIDMSKQGSIISGLMDSFATSISLALQYGVPLRVLVDKFSHVRFEPAGITNNKDIRFAKSIVDYIFRWMGTKFLHDQPHSTTETEGAHDKPKEQSKSNDRITEIEKKIYQFQSDAPPCSDCGAIMVRNGACYKCLNCGSTSGCS